MGTDCPYNASVLSDSDRPESLDMTLSPAYRAVRNALLLAYLVLAVIYSVVTPIFEVSDELWHYPMVQYLATNGFSLPSPSPDALWRQEGGQPPLYYLAAALLTAPIDTS